MPTSALGVTAHNRRFFETVRAVDLHGATTGTRPTASRRPDRRAAHNFFDGSDTVGELDFRDGEGVAVAVSPGEAGALAAHEGAGPRCLLSVVDRTVEVQAERTLRAEMLRDSLTGLPNRLAFTEAIEKPARASRATSTMPCWSSTCCASAESTNPWAASPATNC